MTFEVMQGGERVTGDSKSIRLGRLLDWGITRIDLDY